MMDSESKEYDYDEDQEWRDYSDEEDSPCATGSNIVCKVLDVEGVSARQNELIQQISEMLSLSESESFALLVLYEWQAEKLSEQWLDKEISIREKSGIGQAKGEFTKGEKEATPGSLLTCEVCFSEAPRLLGIQRCGHYYCSLCWSGYVLTMIQEGPKSATRMKCPNVSCPLVVPVSLIREILHSLHPESIKGIKQTSLKKEYLIQDLEKQIQLQFQKFIAMSFTELNKFVRWCPNPGCQYAVETVTGSLSEVVTCKCGQVFCLRCGNQKHLPTTCNIVQDWEKKNKSESKNVSWIMVNTKRCPGCKKPIEKNQGCNRMQCRCGYQFCWLCLVEWNKHGGYGSPCNAFEAQKEKNRVGKAENMKYELDRYLFYYERYRNQERSQTHIKQLKSLLQSTLKLLGQVKGIMGQDTEGIIEAANIVASARMVLKWSYVHAYYLNKKPEELALLQFQQKKLLGNCEHLHELLEKPFEPFFKDETKDSFEMYKAELMNLAKVTSAFFNNFCEGVQEGVLVS